MDSINQIKLDNLGKTLISSKTYKKNHYVGNRKLSQIGLFSLPVSNLIAKWGRFWFFSSSMHLMRQTDQLECKYNLSRTCQFQFYWKQSKHLQKVQYLQC